MNFLLYLYRAERNSTNSHVTYRMLLDNSQNNYIIELKINLDWRKDQQPSFRKYRISQHFHLLLGNLLTSKLLYISCMYEIYKICR